MTGCRNLTDNEVRKVLNTFTGRYRNRNRLLFVLGISTGFRISELLSLKISDVWNGQRVITAISVKASNTKTKKGRRIRLNSSAQSAIKDWIEDEHRPESGYLFSSRKGGAITRQQAHNVLKRAFKEAQLDGTLATHTLRKTFANRLLNNTEATVRDVSRYLGHEDIRVTERYLGIDSEKDAEWMESISIEL